MDEELRQYLHGMEERIAGLIASEIGTLHVQIQNIDRRLRKVDGNTITTMETLTRLEDIERLVKPKP